MSRPTGGLWDNRVTFNGVELATTFDAIVVHGQVLNAPPRTYTRLNIPAKNGVRYIDEGTFGNVTQSYTLIFPENFLENYNNLKAYLMSVSNYAWLVEHMLDDDLSQKWQMQARVTGITYKATRDLDAGKAIVTFDRLPQRWDMAGNPRLLPGEFHNVATWYNNVLTNNYRYDALPVFRVTGVGGFNISNGSNFYTVTVNSYPTTGQGAIQYIDIDSETMDCYYNDINCNPYVVLSHGYPVLHPGDSTVTIGSQSQTVLVSPRWWTI